MHKTLRVAIAASCMAVVAPASGVVLNPRGTGQVLIYPYYTVNAGHGTLLSVVNTTDKGKALKVRFLEGYNGRNVLSFNLYLSPFDVWVAQTFDAGSDAPAALATYDRSCTAPSFSSFDVPGPRLSSAEFRDAGYTGSNADGGPSGPERTREGYVEIIEMGEVTNPSHDTLDAITHGSNGVPSNCGQVVQAWAAGGYWISDATTDLSVPRGGLYGSESIINVAEGTLYAINAEVIDGFSSAVQHTEPGNAAPDLNTASKSADGMVTAFVPYGSGSIASLYAKSEDAISALFMADALLGEYVIDPNVGASSDWLVTFPTKRFYTDPALLQAGATQATRPFDVLFNAYGGGTSCSQAAAQFFDREELTTTGFGCGFVCPTQPPQGFCFTTNAMTIGSPVSVLGSQLQSWNSDGVVDSTSGFSSGQARVEMWVDRSGAVQPNHVLASANGRTLKGLPAIGFIATDYVNANVTAGVLANYSGAYPQRVHVSCLESTNPESPCY